MTPEFPFITILTAVVTLILIYVLIISPLREYVRALKENDGKRW